MVEDHSTNFFQLARAYSIMPFVWCMGAILGPALGGALAQPVKSFPSIFHAGSIFERFPFLLANLVCVAILCCGLIIGTLFLKETHAGFRHKRDVGLQTGKKIISIFKKQQEESHWSNIHDVPGSPEETQELLSDKSSIHSSEANRGGGERIPTPTAAATTKAFTQPVMMNIIAYGLIAYHAISFDQMMPIFLSSPVTHEPAASPFHFTGGFGLSSQYVGALLAIQGVYSMFAQIFLFPFAIRQWGALKTFRTTIILWPLLYVIIPYLVFLPQQLQTTGIMFCLLWRITAQCLAFPTMQILLTNAAPSMLVLGLINGVAASTASLSRAFGPTLSGSLFSFGLSIGHVGLAWWITALISLLGAIQSLWMTEGKGRLDMTDEKNSSGSVEQQ